MPTSIKFLRAEHGDSILIQHITIESSFTILVDGGPTTSFRNYSTKTDGNLKVELDRLSANSIPIDLLILTHIDSDHIGGLLEGFKHPDYLPVIVKSVWFNSATSVAKNLSLRVEAEHYINDDFSASLKTSIQEGETFEAFIKKHKIWEQELICTSYKPNTPDDISLKILSPDMAGLERLLKRWKPYNHGVDLSTGGCAHDYNESYSKLLEKDVFKEDGSPTNGSSISILLEVGGEKVLLLSDAHPSTVANSLRSLGCSETEPLDCKLVKLSHHGSKKNTSPELLSLIKTSCFVVTTDGSSHCLPNKITFARIHQAHPNAKILFNYPELIKKIFSAEEIIELGERIGSTVEAIKIAN